MSPQQFADKYLLALEQANLKRAGLKPAAQCLEAPKGLTVESG